MEVRSGYKQTEAGVIPKDWDAIPVAEVASFTSGQGIKVASLKERSSDYPIPVYGGNGIAGYTSVALTHEPTVVVGRVGQKCGEVYLTDGPAWITDNALYPRHFVNKPDLPFLALALQAVDLNGAKNRNDLPLITQSILHSTCIPLPPTVAEQVVIAKALSDADALLIGLDRLISKKRDLKQATMQQLLTGQTRLPGFQVEWAVKRLGDVLTICHGRSQRGVEAADGPYPILATGGQIGRASQPLYDKPSVLIGRKGTINRPQYMATPFWTVDTLFYSEIKGSNSARYFYYLFCTIDWMQFNEASGVPSLNARTIEAIEIDYPEPSEQAAIAAVLSDMDAELVALEARLNKTRALKQGMMQDLLSGRIRLVASAVHCA